MLFTFKRLCQLAPNSRVKEDKRWFVVEINCKENRQLVNILTRIFLTNILKSTRPSQKKGRHVVVGDLFRKVNAYK